MWAHRDQGHKAWQRGRRLRLDVRGPQRPILDVAPRGAERRPFLDVCQLRAGWPVLDIALHLPSDIVCHHGSRSARKSWPLVSCKDRPHTSVPAADRLAAQHPCARPPPPTPSEAEATMSAIRGWAFWWQHEAKMSCLP